MKKIPLTQGYLALVDDADYEMLSQHRWSVINNGTKYYARRSVHKGTQLPMHRFLMGVTDPAIFVDHIDGNGLNNQRANLRLATPKQNSANIRFQHPGTIYFGVYKQDDGLWAFNILHNGTTRIIKPFGTDREAAIARNEYILAIENEYLPLNTIEGPISQEEEHAARRVFKNKRGQHMIKPREEIKSARLTLRFIDQEYDHIFRVLGSLSLERTRFCCEAVLKAVDALEKAE